MSFEVFNRKRASGPCSPHARVWYPFWPILACTGPQRISCCNHEPLALAIRRLLLPVGLNAPTLSFKQKPSRLSLNLSSTTLVGTDPSGVTSIGLYRLHCAFITASCIFSAKPRAPAPAPAPTPAPAPAPPSAAAALLPLPPLYYHYSLLQVPPLYYDHYCYSESHSDCQRLSSPRAAAAWWAGMGNGSKSAG